MILEIILNGFTKGSLIALFWITRMTVQDFRRQDQHQILLNLIERYTRIEHESVTKVHIMLEN